MQKKHILFVSYDGMTDSLGQSQVIPYISELSKKEFKFSLISFEKEVNFKKFKITINDLCSNNNIDWYPKTYTKKPPIISTMWDIFRMYQETKRIHSKLPIDIIHCRSYQAASIGQRMQSRFNIPWLFDMRGFWADERVDGGIWKLSNPIFRFIYNFYKKKEIEFLIDAGAVISLTENGKDEILSWQSKQTTPRALREKKLDISVIPCCVDTELFNPLTVSSETKAALQISLEIQPDQFVLGYVGSIGTWYMLPEMLDFFKILLVTKPNAIFLFVSNEGDKVREQALQKGISEDKIRIVSCLHSQVASYISLFTASIYFILPAYSKKASSPTKQAELMSMGIPVICNAGVGDSDLIVQKYHAGWVVTEFTEANYAGVIQDIVTRDFSEFSEISQSCKAIFALEKGAEIFENVYRRII